MFKTLETKWNAHTPIYLHNGTKENFLFQLLLGAGIIAGYQAVYKWKAHREDKKFYTDLK